MKNTLMITSHTKLTPPIAILGGTFDPVHLGHLSIAHEIQQTYNLSEIRFLPCWQPVHRDTPLASPLQRLDMLTLAIQQAPTFKIDDSEIRRQGPSYTIDTLTQLREKYPHTPLCLILGLDAWCGFATWNRYEEILNFTHLIIVTRPSYSFPTTGILKSLLEQHQTHDFSTLHQSLHGKIIVHTLSALDISATMIRQKITEGEHLEHLLPKTVYDYIVKEHLYGSKK